MTLIPHTIMCQIPTAQGKKCCDRARWESPAGWKVCGHHRRQIDRIQVREGLAARCTPLSDETITGENDGR